MIENWSQVQQNNESEGENEFRNLIMHFVFDCRPKTEWSFVNKLINPESQSL